MGPEDAFVRYLTTRHHGRLATVGSDGGPQNKPVGYVYNTERHSIDIAGFNMETSAKYHNIQANPNVAFVVDEVFAEGSSGVRFVEIRGRAEGITASPPLDGGLSAQIIRIHPHRLVSWNLDADHPGMHAQDLATYADAARPPSPDEGDSLAHTGPEPARPALATSHHLAAATKAVTALVAELQAGWDQHDAAISDAHLAADVAWGSPYGATVDGFDDLYAIHQRLKQQGAGGSSSRYEVRRVIPISEGVVAAHVARVALDVEGQPVEATERTDGTFSEMALYVLVRHDGTWWLAAGQNTPIRPGGEAGRNSVAQPDPPRAADYVRPREADRRPEAIRTGRRSAAEPPAAVDVDDLAADVGGRR